MLTELCQELRNWFDRERYSGTFAIENGNLTADFLKPGQYFRIAGSIFNDGVHRYPAADLHDEVFDGAVWALAIPKAVLKLDEEIDEWRDKYENATSAALSPFQSESFGGYSYTKASGGSGQNGSTAAVNWRSMFASSLNRWRKI